MRFAVVALLAGLCALAGSHPQQQITDKQFLERQRDILRLFRYVNQPTYYKDQVEIAQSYDISEHYNDYSNPQVAKHYYQIYQYGLLPRGQVFSIFYQEQLQQAIALYRLFYYAKDYQTFYNTAVWARQHVNEGVYLYSLSVAIVHRPDTYGIVLPPIYEVYPYYFYNNEVIQQAYRYKQQYYGQQRQQNQDEHSGFNGYTINANYSGYYLNLNPEQSLSYFTEDVGLNSFYYYYNIYYPYWLGGQEFNYQNDRRGELFYYIYQQLLARYYLERLSNGFGEIEYFNYEVPFQTGYYPSLQYSNGLPFPTRPNYANLYEYFYNYGQRYGNNRYAYSYTRVQDYERRIRDAIDRGYVYSPDGQRVNLNSQEGLNVLGNLIESNPDSPNTQYYGALQVYARHLLGYSYQPLNKYQIVPSALEQYETSLRDPAFYQFYKRVVLYFQQYQSNLPAYTPEDLTFQGVQVTNVEFDRLVTYFDYFYSDLSNAVYVTPEEYDSDRVQVRARQYRLNHKAFTYKIYVKSNEEQQASVRIYIGPKYDEYGRYINISQNRQNFVQFDHFRYSLKSGENVIERNSRQNYFYQNRRQKRFKDEKKEVMRQSHKSPSHSVDNSNSSEKKTPLQHGDDTHKTHHLDKNPENTLGSMLSIHPSKMDVEQMNLLHPNDLNMHQQHHQQNMSHEELTAMVSRCHPLSLSSDHQAMLHHNSMNHPLKQEHTGYTPSNHPFSITRLLPNESKSDIKMYADMQYGYNTLSPLPNSVHSHTSIGNDYYNSPLYHTSAGTTSL